MDATFDAPTETVTSANAERLRASDWLWRPWFAKLWWAAIPVWWAGMAASTKIAPLADFYDGALAGFLNVLFFPMTTLMVLSVGYARNWLDHFSAQGSGTGPVALDIVDPDPFGDEFHNRRFGQPHPSVDIYDPRSGSLWIGNPLSFQHPNRRF